MQGYYPLCLNYGPCLRCHEAIAAATLTTRPRVKGKDPVHLRHALWLMTVCGSRRFRCKANGPLAKGIGSPKPLLRRPRPLLITAKFNPRPLLAPVLNQHLRNRAPMFISMRIHCRRVPCSSLFPQYCLLRGLPNPRRPSDLFSSRFLHRPHRPTSRKGRLPRLKRLRRSLHRRTAILYWPRLGHRLTALRLQHGCSESMRLQALSTYLLTLVPAVAVFGALSVTCVQVPLPMCTCMQCSQCWTLWTSNDFNNFLQSGHISTALAELALPPLPHHAPRWSTIATTRSQLARALGITNDFAQLMDQQ